MKYQIFKKQTIVTVGVLLILYCPVVYSQVVFVSPTGNDQNTGTKHYPFKTIYKAVSVKKVGASLTINLRAGIYFLDKPVLINDSGISIIAYNHEKVVLTGAKSIKLSAHDLITNSKAYKDLPTVAVGQVYAINLRKYGIIDYGQIISTFYANPLKPSGLAIFDEKGKDDYELARWPEPDEPLLRIAKIVTGDTNKPAFIFNYPAQLGKKYTSLIEKNNFGTDCWVEGQFSVGWASDNVPVYAFDPMRRSIQLDKIPNRGLYSDEDKQVQGANNVRGFYFYNSIAFLNRSGEWYLDRKTGMLYVWPVASANTIWISLASEPLFNIQGGKQIKLEYLNFMGSRSGLLTISQSDSITITNCSFSNAGLRGLHCQQLTNAIISNCYFNALGAGGVYLDGGNRRNLTSGNNKILNCEFTNYATRYKTYSPAVRLNGVGNIIEGCYIHDAADQAILFGGNDHVISNNRIEKVCQFYHDMGAIYAYSYNDLFAVGTVIEKNYFTNIYNKYSNAIAAIYIDGGTCGIKISSNTFINCGSQKPGRGFGAIMIGGGAFNQMANNHFINCNNAYSVNLDFVYKKLKENVNRQFNLNTANNKINSADNIYFRTYPYLDTLRNADVHSYVNYISNSIFENVKIKYLNTKNGSDTTNFIIH
ncbi:MAG: right-handed parallel beta-helix repeat-containing protein [Chitinophagaceae bacterium]|nr:right-handed parallel beta-helix repeat-containing protein [Chitinophagaceae bacterium]